MKLTETKIGEFIDLLKSDQPAPGGGSASALAGAQAMALVIMVCELTLGREKYANFQEDCLSAKEEAEKLLSDLVGAIDEDTQAYNSVAEAFKLPKGTDKEKTKRSAAIQKATVKATEVPLSVMKSAWDGMKIISAIIGKTNPSAMSDLGVAVLNLSSCAKGAWLNVKINLPGIKDEKKSGAFGDEASAIYQSIDKLAEKEYQKISELI